MNIRLAKKSDIGEWSRMRSALWPDSPDQHIAEIEEFFTENSVDIVETFVVERPSGNLAGFIELNIRGFAALSLSQSRRLRTVAISFRLERKHAPAHSWMPLDR